MNRREFVQRTTGALASVASASTLGAFTTLASGLLVPSEAHAITSMDNFWLKDRVIDCRRQDTGEKHSIQFFSGQYGQYIPDAYKNACWLMRDRKDQNQFVSMDIGLFNLLYGLQEWARISGKENPVITVNSGYRTSRRNARIEGAARNSLHISGQAADITMRGVDLSQLVQMAKYFKVGGVGIYSTFLHVDTGRVRQWHGK